MGKSCAPGPIPPYQGQQQVTNLHSAEYFQQESQGWRILLHLGYWLLVASAVGFVWWFQT